MAHRQDQLRKFELTIKPAILNPDCYTQSYSSVIINNKFPSPALFVLKGDTVQITLKNDITNHYASSIHIHGIRQLGTNAADGVANVTQVATNPGEKYIQTFHVYNQTGTYYYHAHVGVQDDTIQGPFIVYENKESLIAVQKNDASKKITEGPFTYDGELILQWTEWWHQDFIERQNYYLSSSFIGDTGPDTILLNGRSIYQNTSTLNTSLPNDCQGFTYFDVEPNKIYRLRYIGALTFRILGIAIANHNMTLIEIDGEYLEPTDIDYVELAAGQRMSVLIRTGNFTEGSIFPIATNFRRTSGIGYTQNGYGFLRYACSKNKEESQNTTTIKILETPFRKDLPAVFPLTDPPTWTVLNRVKPIVIPDILNDLLYKEASKTIKISMKELVLENNLTRYINNDWPYVPRPWGNDTVSLLEKVLSDDIGVGVLDALDGFSVNHQTYPLNYMETVDLVFQNVYFSTNICVSHPWHTHGYSHYLLAEGHGDYEHVIHKNIRTFNVPLLKDVSMVYPLIDSNNNTDRCGWIKVRIITDNPGVWAVHCHITAHMLQGKMIVIEVEPKMLFDDMKY